MTHTITLDAATEELAAEQARSRGVSTEQHLTAQLTQAIHGQEQTPQRVSEHAATEMQTLEVLLAQFQAEDPRTVPDPAREAYRANPMDAVLTQKYRRQGLNLS